MLAGGSSATLFIDWPMETAFRTFFRFGVAMSSLVQVAGLVPLAGEEVSLRMGLAARQDLPHNRDTFGIVATGCFTGNTWARDRLGGIPR